MYVTVARLPHKYISGTGAECIDAVAAPTDIYSPLSHFGLQRVIHVQIFFRAQLSSEFFRPFFFFYDYHLALVAGAYWDDVTSPAAPVILYDGP
jgi:hypothetical protein